MDDFDRKYLFVLNNNAIFKYSMLSGFTEGEGRREGGGGERERERERERGGGSREGE